MDILGSYCTFLSRLWTIYELLYLTRKYSSLKIIIYLYVFLGNAIDRTNIMYIYILFGVIT